MRRKTLVFVGHPVLTRLPVFVQSHQAVIYLVPIERVLLGWAHLSVEVLVLSGTILAHDIEVIVHLVCLLPVLDGSEISSLTDVMTVS